MRINEIIIGNFRRYHGLNRIKLGNKGTISIIAAQNGVGKTTILDSIFLGLYGSKGYEKRIQETGNLVFSEWLIRSALNVKARHDDFPVISFKLK